MAAEIAFVAKMSCKELSHITAAHRYNNQFENKC